MKIQKVILVLAMLILPVSTFGQTDDRLSGNALEQKIKEFQTLLRYDSAAYYADLATKAYEEEENFKRASAARFFHSFFLSKLLKFDEAINTCETALGMGEKYIGDFEKSWGLRTLGIILMEKGDFEASEQKLLESYQVAQANDSLNFRELEALAAHYLGTLYNSKSAPAISIAYFETAAKIFGEMPEENPAEFYTTYNLAIMLTNSGALSQSIEYFERSEKLMKKFLPDPEPMLSYIYIGLGSTYSSQRLTARAIEYYRKALSISRKISATSPNMVFILNPLSQLLSETGETEEAIALAEEAVRVALALYGTSHVETGWAYYTLGRNYQGLKMYERAFEAMNKAIRIFRDVQSKEGELTARFDVGWTYADMGQIERGLSIQAAVLREMENQFEKTDQRFIKNAQYLGEKFLEVFQPDSALLYFNKSIEANFEAYTNSYGQPSLSVLQHVNPLPLLFTLIGKAKALEQVKGEDISADDLIEIYQLVQQSDSVYTSLREKSKTLDDQLNLRRAISQSYDLAVRTCIRLFEKTGENDYRNAAFIYSEKNKANLALGNYLEAGDLRYGFIPDSLISLENDLQREIAFLETELLLKRNSKSQDTAVIVSYENILFQNKEKLDALLEFLESDYPNYYSLKFDHSYLSPGQVQKTLLKSKELLISFHWGKQDLYAFRISKSDIDLSKIPIDSAFKKDVLSFVQVLTNPESQPDAYAQLNKSIVSNLLGTYESMKSFDRIIVIPDKILSLVPFGALSYQSNSGSTPTSFTDFNYAIRHHDIGYANSATMLLKQRETALQNNGAILGFAPVYEASENTNRSVDVTRAEAGVLQWTKEEIESIGDYFNTDYYIGEEAKENILMEQGSAYAAVHIASHGLIQDSSPMLSRLMFASAENDSTSDGYLNTREIYGLQLPVEMVVLSACNTGDGEIVDGEGVISLASGFFYAGSKSVVMTLWQANDQSTAAVMNDFYRSLADGERKEAALRSAKLQYIEEADNIRAHPYFWAHFVANGDLSPMVKNGLSKYVIWFVCALLVLIALAVFRGRPKKGTS